MDEQPSLAESGNDVLEMVEDYLKHDVEEEDAPDWVFEDGEVRSKDPSYVFCPAAHRNQLI